MQNFGEQNSPPESNGSSEGSPYFRYSATLRIFGHSLDFSEITASLGLQPTRVHHEGERRGGRYAAYPHDMWALDAPLEESEPLEQHIAWLYAALQPHLEYLKSLKKHATVDIFCGYYSNSATAGFEVTHHALRLFLELEVPFGVSVVVLEDENS